MSPQQHPNATITLLVGLLSAQIIVLARKAGIELTTDEVATGLPVLLSLVLFLGKKKGITPASVEAALTRVLESESANKLVAVPVPSQPAPIVNATPQQPSEVTQS